MFFDRLSDLLFVEKQLGRQLIDKNMATISCGSGLNLKEGFSIPFTKSANYLGMNYLGNIHTWLENDTAIPKELKSTIINFTNILN